MGCDKDRGYNAINLAFVLELIAEQEKGEIDEGKAARGMSLKIRKEIVAVLDPENKSKLNNNTSKLGTRI